MSPRKSILRFFLYIFSRPQMLRLNLKMLNISLRSLGYNNTEDYDFTGEYAAYLKFLHKCDGVFIDIGANTGETSVYVLENTSLAVVAFEPVRETYGKLTALKLRFPNRFQSYDIALSDHSGTDSIMYGDNDKYASLSNQVNSLTSIRNINKKKQIVKVEAFDDFVPVDLWEQIVFVKVDVEGSELEVLRGMKKFIEQAPPKFIQIEFNFYNLHRRLVLNDYCQLLRGYDPFQILYTGIRPLDPNSFDANIFTYMNVLFIRKH